MAAKQHVEEPQAPERSERPAVVAPSWWSHPDGPARSGGAVFGPRVPRPHGAFEEPGAADQVRPGAIPGQRRWRDRLPLLGRRAAMEHPAVPPATPRRRSRSRAALIVAIVAVLGSLIGGMLGMTVESATEGGRLDLLKAPVATRETSHTAVVLKETLPSVVYLQVASDGHTSTGTGVILDANGHILTNNHVIAPDGTVGAVTVTFSTGQRHPAAVLGRDVGSDLAVLRVSGVSGLSPATLGDSDDVEVGDPVMAIGAPYGLRGTVTSGIVSAVDRPIVSGSSDAPPGRSYLDALQTDAPINPGNSGGPLLDQAGTVIGINTAIRSSDPDSSDPFGSGSSSGSIGLGFAIPIDQATVIAGQLITTGRASPPSIGVTLDRGFDGGAKIVSVRGKRAPLRGGDVITGVDGVAVTGADDLIALVRGRKQGGATVLTVLRNGQSLRIVANLSPSPADSSSTRA